MAAKQSVPQFHAQDTAMPEPHAASSRDVIAQPVIADWKDSLAMLLAATSDVVCGTDVEGTAWRYFNPAAERAFGCSVSAIQQSGRSLSDWVHAADRAAFDQAVARRAKIRSRPAGFDGSRAMAPCQQGILCPTWFGR